MNPLATNPVTMVYHELRAPLGLVATAARSAAEDCEDDFLRSRCQVIVRAAERMLRTASNIFALVQADTDTALDSFDPLEVVKNLAFDLRELGIDVRLEAPPEAAVQTRGSAQFEAVVQSLLMNAYDHREAGTQIHVKVTVSGGAFSICVRNTMDRTGRHHGLGVGMFICQQLAEHINGTVTTSDDGQEFCASLQLPIGAL